MELNQIKSETYEEFKNYVETVVRERTNNPRATVQSFMQIPPSGDSHMVIRLDHVMGSLELFELIKKFRPGAELKEEENFTSGAPRHLAYIPFGLPPKRRGRGRHYEERGRVYAKPPTWVAQASVFVFLVLSIVYLQIKH